MGAAALIGSRVQALNERLEKLLQQHGLTPSAVQGGVSYKIGRRSLCRIDPKMEFLRVYVGDAAERSAPPELRGPYRQRGWLIVRPDNSDTAEAYLATVLASVRAGIP